MTTTTRRTGPPPAGVPTAPPLPEDVHALLRRLRMPHTRAAAPEVLATARAQRWEPVEVGPWAHVVVDGDAPLTEVLHQLEHALHDRLRPPRVS